MFAGKYQRLCLQESHSGNKGIAITLQGLSKYMQTVNGEGQSSSNQFLCLVLAIGRATRPNRLYCELASSV